MVEGPGCTRNGQKARSAVLGRRIIGVAGLSAAQIAGSIRGRTLVDVITLGKQLWLLFSANQGDEIAVRCHFGMAGSLFCNKAMPTGQKKLTLLIRFESDGELRIFDSTAALANAQAARDAASTGQFRDVCNASSFSSQAALTALLIAAPPSRMIADVLLDQNVLPGVGNIIKVECSALDAQMPRTSQCSGFSHFSASCAPSHAHTCIPTE